MTTNELAELRLFNKPLAAYEWARPNGKDLELEADLEMGFLEPEYMAVEELIAGGIEGLYVHLRTALGFPLLNFGHWSAVLGSSSVGLVCLRLLVILVYYFLGMPLFFCGQATHHLKENYMFVFL
jgi:hypothetical protein